METAPWRKGTKKDVGVIVSLPAYPYYQALALPLGKDKQRKACPRRVNIHIHTTAQSSQTYIYADKPRQGLHLIIYIKGNGRRDTNITYANASVASPLFQDSNVLDLIVQIGNVLKTSFRDWPYKRPEVSFPIMLLYEPKLSRMGILGCKDKYIF